MNFIRPNRKKARVHAVEDGKPLCAVSGMVDAIATTVRAVVVWQYDIGEVTCRRCGKILQRLRNTPPQ